MIEFVRLYWKPLLLWAIWLVVGTIFYAIQNENGWVLGFYMAVDVGYSIGWGYPSEISDNNMVFSIFYILGGASLVAASLSAFAQGCISSSKSWHVTILKDEEIKNSDIFSRSRYWIISHQQNLLPIAFWLIWVGILAIYTCNKIGWSVVQGIYCAVSSYSTAGTWPIPLNASDETYLMVGCFSAIGVPLMAWAMGHLASLLIDFGDPDALKKAIHAPVSESELQLLKKLGLEDGDGRIEKSEYILLCAMRIGALSPDAVEAITDNFNAMDRHKRGSLSYEEILACSNENSGVQSSSTSTAAMMSNKKTVVKNHAHVVPVKEGTGQGI